MFFFCKVSFRVCFSSGGHLPLYYFVTVYFNFPRVMSKACSPQDLVCRNISLGICSYHSEWGRNEVIRIFRICWINKYNQACFYLCMCIFFPGEHDCRVHMTRKYSLCMQISVIILQVPSRVHRSCSPATDPCLTSLSLAGKIILSI